MEANEFNGSNQSCLQFTSNEVKDITTVRIALSAAALLACSALTLLMIAQKAYKQYLQRLFVYLMIASIFYSLTLVLQVVPVQYNHSSNVIAVRNGFGGFCIAAGFLSEIASVIFYSIIFWIILYIFLFTVFKYRANKKKHEIFGFVTSILIPLFFNSLPFIQNMYGLSGGWCWIRPTKEDCDSDNTLGFVYQFGLFFGPITLQAVLSLIVSVIIIIALCNQSQAIDNTNRIIYGQALKEILPLFVYILILNSLLSLTVANRILYLLNVNTSQPYYPLWMANAIAEPTQLLLLPLFFLLLPNTCKKLSCRRQNYQPDTSTTFQVSNIESGLEERDPLIIRAAQGAGGDYQSTKHVIPAEFSSNG